MIRQWQESEGKVQETYSKGQILYLYWRIIMLSELRIQNFKGWQDTGAIRMAPITLLFGTNSSGKSSIGQFLMMLRQTVDSPDRKAVFYPGGKATAVQLGSYQEMVYRRDRNTDISFEYKWVLNDPMKIKDHISSQTFSGKELAFSALVGLGESDQHSLILKKLQYKLINNEEISFSIRMERRSTAKSEYRVESEKYPLKRKSGRVWPPGAPARFYGFPDEVVSYYQNAAFVQELNLKHEKLFRSIFYLGPLRTKTDRLYSWTGIEPESVGYSGENTVAALLAARNRRINLGYRKPAKPFEILIAEKLKEMELIEEFKVNPISEQRHEFEVKICTKGSPDLVDLPDVGFGISQVLPVIVQCFYVPAGSIIIMEQPEIHLHPRAQSALADVMIDVINARENSSDRNIQLIIETHSEHFLRRLQRRIAEDKIKEDKISAYFADMTSFPAKLEPLRIDIFGNIINWPEKFFGDEMGDITAQAKAAMQKKASQPEIQQDLENEQNS
jgi:predicted ATPase